MEIPPWISVAITLATPLALAGWQVYQFTAKRTDDRLQRSDQQEDKHLALLTREREQLAASNEAVVKSLRQEVDRRTEALHECEADRHVGYDLARFWHSHAWTMLGHARNARQVAESAATKAGLPAPLWNEAPILELPPFDGMRLARPPATPPVSPK